VVFGGFAPAELAARIEDARPVVVLAASCGIEPSRVVEYKPLLDAALDRSSHKPEAVVVLQREQARAAVGERDTDWEEMDWAELVADAEPADCVDVDATDPLYILDTSGTTGRPKGIVRDNGGHAVALRWSMTNVFGISPGDTWFTASDVGWVVGHSYIVYAPLLTGATSVLYEGKPVGTPDAGAFWRVVSDYGVKAMFTAPTAYRAIKRDDPEGALMAGYDLSSLETVFLAGERLDPDTWEWATQRLGVPVVDNWWQTETGWPIAANLRGLEPMPIKAGSPTVPVPGYAVEVLGEGGRPVPAGEEGAICIRLPLPPGTLPTLWGDDDRYVAGYLSAFDGYYLTGDGGFLDEDGYLFVMGRTDDVLNVAGHRLSTGSIEAALAGHPAVAECAVIGVHDDLKGQVPRALVVLKAGVDRGSADAVAAELRQRVRDEVGAIASLQRVDVVAALPKTRSGKILRKTMREMADGLPAKVPGTIEDASVLETLAPVLAPPP
jgi:propionyl-CoA synthetase